MEKTLIENKIKEEFQTFENYICSHYALSDCFKKRIGQDIAIAQWFNDYFRDMIYVENSEALQQAKTCLTNSVKHNANLFQYLISETFANDKSFDFQDYNQISYFLNDVITYEKTQQAMQEYILDRLED